MGREVVRLMPDWEQLRTMASTTACHSTRETAVLQTDTRGKRRLWAPEMWQGQTSCSLFLIFFSPEDMLFKLILERGVREKEKH